jgi:Ca2+-binding EF-hand superfamily protein
MNEKLFTTDYIEKQLHRKIEAYTPSDMDRFRKVLILCRTQNAASREELGLGVPDGVSGVTKRDFRKLLSWLGLFATEKQAYELFDKYDVNGDGTLTVHEFLTQIRPPDFPARGGTVEKPKTPHPDVMNYSVKDLAMTIRTKLSGSGKVGQVYTDARGKRDLLKLFYFHDPTRSGMVTNKQFLNCMMMIGVNSLGQIHLEMIFNKFMVDPTAVNKAEIIDYIAFSEYVFPEWDKPPAYFKELTLDTRGKHYVQNPYDKTVELRTGRLSEAGSARLTSLSRPGSRSMTRSTSEAQLSGRTTKSGRRMQRSATSSNLRAQTPNEEQEFSFNLAPGESSLTNVKRMQVPSKNANPLLAAMPDHYYRLKSKNRNAIVL